MVIGPCVDPLHADPKAHQFVAGHPLKLCLHVREVPKRIIVPNRFPLRMVVNWELKEFGLEFRPLGGRLLSVVEPEVGPHITI